MVPFDLKVVRIIQPETLVCWIGGLSLLLAVEITATGGRPQIEADLRTLIRRMSVENRFGGATHSRELLKLGFASLNQACQIHVKRRGPPSRGGALPAQHARYCCDGLFVVDIGFDLLYASSCAARCRGSSGSTSRQTPPQNGCAPANEAFLGTKLRTTSSAIGSNYGAIVTRDYAPWHPGQAYCTSLALAERLCRTVDRIDPRELLTISSSWARASAPNLRSYARYYNDIRTHRSLDKDAPVSRPFTTGSSLKPILGGLIALRPV